MGRVSKETVVRHRWEIDPPLYELTQPTIPPFAPRKGQRSKRQLMLFKLSTVVKFKLSTPQLINPILIYVHTRVDAMRKFGRHCFLEKNYVVCIGKEGYKLMSLLMAGGKDML